MHYLNQSALNSVFLGNFINHYRLNQSLNSCVQHLADWSVRLVHKLAERNDAYSDTSWYTAGQLNSGANQLKPASESTSYGQVPKKSASVFPGHLHFWQSDYKFRNSHSLFKLESLRWLVGFRKVLFQRMWVVNSQVKRCKEQDWGTEMLSWSFCSLIFLLYSFVWKAE